MARPKATDTPDLTKAVRLTVGAIERLTCPPDKEQAFLRDADAKGLRVRVTRAGAKSFVFESKLKGSTLRRTFGDVRSWTIEQAREAARELAVMVDKGTDPREVERQAIEAREAEQRAAQAAALTVGEVWPIYLAKGRPKRKAAWKPRYLADMHAMALPGGEKKKRGEGTTRPGPLYPLMGLALAEVTEDTLTAWFDREAEAGPHQATRALMMFRGFLRWCSARPEYRHLTKREAGSAPAIIENLPSAKRRTDKLLKEQIGGWWSAVTQLPSLTQSVYLRALLLTGARREEVAALKWADVDFRWKKLTLADKYEATRTIPLGPYMAHMLAGLPRTSAWVFPANSASGHLEDARTGMDKAQNEAEVGHLTFHGLRRTFTQTARRVVPAGAAAQIQGHAQTAVAEGYNILTLDELRPYLETIEGHFLELAGVTFERKAEPGKLALVAA